MNTVDHIAERIQEEKRLYRCARNWDLLIRFCGYVENGSDTTVSLGQDDATRTWVLRVGKHLFYGSSPTSVLEAAVNELGEPE
jgi:hypothetical protein